MFAAAITAVIALSKVLNDAHTRKQDPGFSLIDPCCGFHLYRNVIKYSLLTPTFLLTDNVLNFCKTLTLFGGLAGDTMGLKIDYLN